MVEEPVLCHLFPLRSGHAVIAVRIDGNASARSKLSPHFNILRIHELYQVLHDYVYAVFMEVAVITE